MKLGSINFIQQQKIQMQKVSFRGENWYDPYVDTFESSKYFFLLNFLAFPFIKSFKLMIIPLVSILSFIYLFLKKSIKYNIVFSYILTFIFIMLPFGLLNNMNIWYLFFQITTGNILFLIADKKKCAKLMGQLRIKLGEELELNGGTRRFQHSAMTPYAFNDGYYALPYTQSFLMMFYRTDMFAEYGWDIPETWDDVIQLVPELQIMNFQFYLPLNTAGASSVVNQIFASHLYQNVGDIYQAFYRNSVNEFGEEYIESNFDSEEAQEAFEFWCNFYTEYSFPLAASFVNRFRSGETPIGIVGYDIYNTLAVSAPEIRGKWNFALLPGTEEKDENGNIVIDHQGAASGMSMIMMGTTDNPYEAWAFMDWFTSADTQVSYAREIEAILGAAARHNTANVAAFTRLSWTEQEKTILMEQWKQTHEMPNIAGSYMTGREMENAFRQVINNLYNAREVLYEYAFNINNEIDRKRKEFNLPLKGE